VFWLGLLLGWKGTQMKDYDAILVPGGGVRQGGELPVWVKRRFDKVLDLHKGETIITLSAGTLLKPPPLDNQGFPVFESVAGAKYLMNHGIPPGKILVETCSYDTIGNAFFARLIHVEPRKFRKLLIITSEFHMPRTETIFKWIFGLNPVLPAYELDFLAVSDEGMEEAALNARKIAEKANLAKLELTKTQFQTLEELHQWLFTKHAAYAVSTPPPGMHRDDNLLKTY
jgi:hypothetical protein